MRACAELHILVSKCGDLGVAQTRLDGDEQERSVSPPDPCPGIWSCQKGSGLFVREKLSWATLVPFGRDGKNALTVEGKSRFGEAHVTEEGVV